MITRHFDRTPDEGFTHLDTQSLARRQLRASIVLIVCLALASLATMATLRVAPPDQNNAPTAAKFAPSSVKVAKLTQRS